MKKKLIIKEKYSKFWPTITIISLFSAIITFYFYWSVSDLLLEGYLRLFSFIFFALGILSLFKLKDGQIEIITLISGDVIKLEYKTRSKIIHTEEWSVNEFETIRIDEMPNRSLYNDLIKGDRCLRFRRNKHSDWIYLNSIHGRVIPLSKNNAEELYRFLSNA